MRYALLVSYDGTDFAGFQKQPRDRTVQGELERAAEQIFGTPVKITGSGRTDAGVHALAQVCCFDAQTPVPAAKIAACFNRILPPDLRVVQSAAAPETFDCTRSAKRKTYCYSFYYAPADLPLFDRFAVRLPQKPDLKAMRAAAELLEGEHDFKAFCASGSSAKTSVRTVYSVKIDEQTIPHGAMWKISVCGSGFLYNMVRIIAGELIAIGCGKREGITAALETGARERLAKTMPAKGLCLMNVDYGAELFPAGEE
jgi:tRNA pseudouridine38-40 synthase